MNLLLVNHFVEYMNELLPDVVTELRRMNFDGRLRLVYDVTPQWKHHAWTLGQPTAVVSFRPIQRFLPRWAQIFQSQPFDKIQELTILERSGLPVAKWLALHEGEIPDLSAFDEYVVVKPANGACGAWVKIMRRSRVRWRSIEVKDLGWSKALIVQKYIYTGSWPVSYRVGTVFGEPIYVFRVTADKSRAAIENPKSWAGKTQNGAGTSVSTFEGFGGKSIVSSGKGCVFDEEVPEEIIELGKRVHAAFPDIPLLGTDILKDADTGELYVSEVNAIGGHFNLTSDIGRNIFKEFGIDFKKRFGGAKAVARGIFRKFSDAEFDSIQRFEPVGPAVSSERCG